MLPLQTLALLLTVPASSPDQKINEFSEESALN
jgi:hypothetical protein